VGEDPDRCPALLCSFGTSPGAEVDGVTRILGPSGPFPGHLGAACCTRVPVPCTALPTLPWAACSLSLTSCRGDRVGRGMLMHGPCPSKHNSTCPWVWANRRPVQSPVAAVLLHAGARDVFPAPRFSSAKMGTRCWHRHPGPVEVVSPTWMAHAEFRPCTEKEKFPRQVTVMTLSPAPPVSLRT